jgi:3-oxoacyl-[acyl-carrier protein] reductase
MGLDGKLALVTGASRPHGIGKATALALAGAGADVVVTGLHNMDGADSLAREIASMGRRSKALKMDATDYGDVKKGFAEVKAELGPVDILVNNAALMNHNVTMAKTTIEEWDYEVKLCLNSAFYCVKEAWADMCGRGWGRIVNITSVAGVLGGYGQTSYGAAKAGLIGLAKSIALEGARFNITANCVIVGISQTDAAAKLPEPVLEKVEKRTAIGRAAKPEEIADAVLFAVSSPYMTGAVVNMLGGLDLFVF